MPVRRRAVLLRLVRHRHLDGVAPVGADGRARVLVVEEEADTLVRAVRVARRVGDGELVGLGLARARPLAVKVRGDGHAVCPAGAGVGPVGAGGVALLEKTFWQRPLGERVARVHGVVAGAVEDVAGGDVAEIVFPGSFGACCSPCHEGHG